MGKHCMTSGTKVQYTYRDFQGERTVNTACVFPMAGVVMPVEMYVSALGNNGVQDSRAHKLACLVHVQEHIHIPAITHSTRSYWALLELINLTVLY